MNPSTALATVLVYELLDQGVRHVVLCPGSRSAPLAYALRAAEREGRVVLHVRVDERSAGFLALGLAKLTRVPAVVVTTSGTAVANLHPAVLEAHHGVVPLVVVSADRPVELRGTGANQTTTQPGMFGDSVRWSVDVAPAVRARGEVARWRSVGAEAVAWATGRAPAGTEPGPVHVNVQLREPLVPTEDEPWPETLDAASPREPEVSAPPAAATSPAVSSATAVPSATDRSEPSTHASAVSGDASTAVSAAPEPAARTLVVIGDLPEPDQFERAVQWARSHGWPVVAEPFGTHPRGDVVPHGQLVLADPSWLADHEPERVVAIGRLTLSRPVAALLRRPGVLVEAVRAHDWIDSRPGVHAVHPLAVLDTAGHVQTGTDWADAWLEAGARVRTAVADIDLPWPSGLAVAQTVVRELPSGARLFVGSSNSARDVDLAAEPRDEELTIVASRGLAGIDGCVSTAIGLALSTAEPTYALMGDLTFLHDANGLLIGPADAPPDLTLVVVNDDGGGIFTLLEPGEPGRARDFERLFGTPTGTDLTALCAAHGVAHERISTKDELVGALRRTPSGLRVLEVAVDRAGHRELHAQLRQLAARALA